MSDPSWLRQPSVLLKRPATFFPDPTMTLPERGNAFSRLFLYVGLVLYAYARDARWIWMSLAAAVTIAGIHDAAATTDRRLSGKKCRKSTPNNAMGNPLVGDSPALDPCVSTPEEIRSNFNQGLFRNVEDIFEKGNSQRQFIPINSAIPDTIAFSQFLAKDLPGRHCKEDVSACTGLR